MTGEYVSDIEIILVSRHASSQENNINSMFIPKYIKIEGRFRPPTCRFFLYLSTGILAYPYIIIYDCRLGE